MDYSKICEDSALHHMLDFSSDDNEGKKKLEEIYNILNIQP